MTAAQHPPPFTTVGYTAPRHQPNSHATLEGRFEANVLYGELPLGGRPPFPPSTAPYCWSRPSPSASHPPHAHLDVSLSNVSCLLLMQGFQTGRYNLQQLSGFFAHAQNSLSRQQREDIRTMGQRELNDGEGLQSSLDLW